MFYTISGKDIDNIGIDKDRLANTLESLNSLIEVESLYDLNSVPVTEGYVGKTKTLMEIEKTFAKMIQNYGPRSMMEKNYHDLEDCPEKKDVQDLICREFGFNSATLVIQPMALIGAGTQPMSYFLRDFTQGMPTALTLHGERYYDVAHRYDFVGYMYTELFDGRFTAGEITALLLNLIGHNFDITIMTYFADFIFWGFCLMTGNIFRPLLRNYIDKIIWKVENLLLRITPITILMNLSIELGKLFSMITGPLGLGRLARIINETPVFPYQMLAGVGADKFADSFAAAYGYGPELISALDKEDRYFLTTNRGVLADTWTWMGDACATIVFMFINPHAENQTRARMMLDDMKKLSESKDVPPHVKKVALKDYQLCKKAYDDFLQVEKSDRDAICLRLSRNFKEEALAGKASFFSYFFSCSAIQTGRKPRREWS